MRPHKLTISGFLSYGGCEVVDFDKLSSAGGLFLIQGATGAGKTSILDAISFALYGRLPGKRSEGKSSTYRSDFASIDTPTYVELDVTLRNGRYMIYRSPAYKVPKKRGEGLTSKESETKIKKWANGGWEPYSGNVAESSGDISGLIGLKPEQFFKLILLPQGDFAKFLHSSSKDRQAILEDLFSDEIDKFKKLTDHFWDYYTEVKKVDEESARDVLAEIQRINQTFSTVYADAEPDLALTKPNSADLTKSYISVLSNTVGITNSEVEAAETLKDQALEQELAANTIYDNSSKVIDAKNKFEAAEQKLKEWRKNNTKILALKIKDESVLKELGNQIESINGEISSVNVSNAKIVELIELREDVHLKTHVVQEAISNLKDHDDSVKTDLEQIKALELKVNSDENPGQDQAENKLAIKELEDQITLANNWIKSEKAIAKLKADLDKLLAAHEKALADYIKAQNSYESQQASILAEKLEDGAPCPVCGGTDHPKPAKKHGSLTKEAVTKALDASNEAANKLASKQGELDSEIAKSAEYEGGKKLDVKKLKEEVDTRYAKDGDFKKAIETLAKARTDLQKLKVNQEKHSAAREEFVKAKSDAEAALKSAKIAVTKAEKALKIEADGEVETVDVEPLEIRVSALRQLTEVFEPIFVAFKDAESGFKAVATSGAEEVPDIAFARKAREDAEANLNQLTLKLGRFMTLEKELKKIEKDLRAAEGKQQKAKFEVERYEHLAKYFKGQTGEKITLVSYFLGQRLFQILDAANKRMLTMTRGQFSLQTNHDKKGAGQNYLSIAVLDSWNNGIRDATALSGGETFTASLALAFGLADVVTSEAGGQSLDSLFIDEGFGSLDPDYLQAVMQSLEELRESGRVIGLISHVEEMKQRISMQLVVSKDGNVGTQVKVVENIGG